MFMTITWPYCALEAVLKKAMFLKFAKNPRIFYKMQETEFIKTKFVFLNKMNKLCQKCCKLLTKKSYLEPYTTVWQTLIILCYKNLINSLFIKKVTKIM